MAVIAYVKDHGARGVVTATPDDIAAVKYVPEENVRLALQLDMFKVDGQTIQVLEWQDFQIDPTNSKRQKKHRESEDKSNGNKRDVTLRDVITVSNDYTDTDTDTDTTRGSAEELAALFVRTSEYGANRNFDFLTMDFTRLLEKYPPEAIRLAIARAGPKAESVGLVKKILADNAVKQGKVAAADAEAKWRYDETQKMLAKEKANYEARLLAERQAASG
jgi:hypothetical protein